MSLDDFGHCSGVYDTIEGVIYTAAHCYHNKSFHIRTNGGELLFDLKEAEYNYFENVHGLVDIFSISAFGPIDEEQLKTHASPVSSEPMEKDRYYPLGFPSKHKEEKLVRLNCEPLRDFKNHFIFNIEESLGTRHLKCPFYQIGSQNFEDFSEHSEVAGLSGGGVFHNGELVGVIYQFGDRRKEEFGIYYQYQSLESEDLSPISVPQAQRKYQLATKIFEEIKVPNLISTELNLLFLLKLMIYDNRQSKISNIQWLDDQTLSFDFIGFDSLEVKKSDLSLTLEKYLVLSAEASQ